MEREVALARLQALLAIAQFCRRAPPNGRRKHAEFRSLNAGRRGTFLDNCGPMVIDSRTFTDIARHLHGISEGLLDGMKKVVCLNPDAPTDDLQRMRTEWLQAVEAFVRVNHEVLTLAELLRALLDANQGVAAEKSADQLN